MPDDQLTIRQTATGYWIVQRGDVELAGAVTRQGAEAERELLIRLSRRHAPVSPPPDKQPLASKPATSSAGRSRRPRRPARV